MRAHAVVAAVLLCAACAVRAAPGLLVVSGIGGAEEYSQQFRTWALEMVDAATLRLGLPAQRVIWLCESPSRDPQRCTGESRRDAVLAALARLARDDAHGDPLMLLLIGHGTARDGRALFNLPGPDLSADDLAEALGALGDRPVAVVNTAPASAPFATVLAGRGRAVVTATASSAENDHTRFAGHFVAAYSATGADRDKDGRVSLLEAFRFAAHEVAREYERKQQLLTEHAMLEDSGDGEASRDPGPDARDGAAAAAFHLSLAPDVQAGSPAAQALEREARDLASQVATLRRRRVAMEPGRYRAALEELLVALALNRRALREAAP